MQHITQGQSLPQCEFQKNLPFPKDKSCPGVTKIDVFFSFPYTGIGGKSTFVCTDVPGSTRVYHPLTHIGHQIYLWNDLNYSIFPLSYICPRRIVVSCSTPALRCMMARLPIYEAISLFLKGGVRSFGTGVSKLLFLLWSGLFSYLFGVGFSSTMLAFVTSLRNITII